MRSAGECLRGQSNCKTLRAVRFWTRSNFLRNRGTSFGDLMAILTCDADAFAPKTFAIFLANLGLAYEIIQSRLNLAMCRRNFETCTGCCRSYAAYVSSPLYQIVPGLLVPHEEG